MGNRLQLAAATPVFAGAGLAATWEPGWGAWPGWTWQVAVSCVASLSQESPEYRPAETSHEMEVEE